MQAQPEQSSVVPTSSQASSDEQPLLSPADDSSDSNLDCASWLDRYTFDFTPLAEFLPLMYLSSFCLVNLLLFNIFLSYDYYAEVSATLQAIFNVIYVVLSSVLVFYACRKVLSSALVKLKQRRISNEVSIALALLLAWAYAVYALLFEFSALSAVSLSNSIIVIVFLLSFSNLLSSLFRSKLANASKFNLRSQISRARVLLSAGIAPSDQPVTANQLKQMVKEDQTWVDVDQIRPKDIFRVLEGEVVACDSVIIKGCAEIQEREFAGNFRYRLKSVDDHVYAGSVVSSGSIDCQALARSEDASVTTMEQLKDRSLSDLKTEVEAGLEEEGYYNVALIVVAIFMAQIWSMAGATYLEVLTVAVSIILMASVLSPFRLPALLYRIANVRLFKQGVLFKTASLFPEIKNSGVLALEYSASSTVGQTKVQSFEILDQRLEKKGLWFALIAILNKSNDEIYLELAHHLKQDLDKSGDKLPLSQYPRITDFLDYHGRGVIAKVEGVDFTLGSEEMLIERGVQVQSSDIVNNSSADQEYLYLAISEYVVARFKISAGLIAQGADVVKDLSRLGVRTVLLSTENQAAVDRIGKRLGLELPDIFANLDDQAFFTKLHSLEGAMFMANQETPSTKIKASGVSMSVYDDVMCDTDRTAVTFFTANLSIIPKLIKVVRSMYQIRLINYLILAALAVTVLTLVGFGYLGPAGVLALSIVGSTLVFFNTWRLAI